MSALDVTTDECPVCLGAGEVIRSRIISRWADPADAEYAEPCQECVRGAVLIQVQPIELADLAAMAGDETQELVLPRRAAWPVLLFVMVFWAAVFFAARWWLV